MASRSADGLQALTAEDEQDLAFEGLLTFADRPKGDAGSSIAKLQTLGVDVKIITGDNGLVAVKVCSDIGLKCTGVLSGKEVLELDDDQLEAAILSTTVFARIGPDEKSRIIKVARRTGKDVAFLGDGVTMRSRCIMPMSESQWIRGPMSPRMPPMWFSLLRTSASWPRV